MSTAPVVPVVEPEVKERQETDAYIAERQKEKNAPPPPVVIETTKPATPEELAAVIPEPLKGKSAEEIKAVLDNAIPPEMVDRQAVDAYITEREKGKRRKNRGGTQARIDELTAQKAEAEAKAAEAVKAAEEVKKAATPAPIPKPPEPEPPKPVETPKAAPKMSEYTDVDKYNADMALWAATQVKPTEVKPPEVVKEPEYLKVRQDEFDKFLERGKAYIVSHPDFNTTLEAAHVRGLTMSEAARTAITRMAVPEVAYWLAKPENDLAARNLMKMDDLQQVVEVGKIAERLAVKPSDFVSSAPAPGLRIAGNVQPNVPLNEITDTDEYIRQRRQLKRAGMRGR
jgi:hypothetical protein